MLDRSRRRFRDGFVQADRTPIGDYDTIGTGAFGCPQYRSEISRIFDPVEYDDKLRSFTIEDLVDRHVLGGGCERDHSLMIHRWLNELRQCFTRNPVKSNPSLACKIEYFLEPLFASTLRDDDTIDAPGIGSQRLDDGKDTKRDAVGGPFAGVAILDLSIRGLVRARGVLPLSHKRCQCIREYLVSWTALLVVKTLERSFRANPDR
jgi:hypothetical protein